MYIFDNFTKNANDALNKSIEIASNFGHSHIGSEHILLGLLSEEKGVCFSILSNFNLSYKDIYIRVLERLGKAKKTVLSTDDFTAKTKKILKLSVMHSSRLEEKYVGTEHLLMAIADERDSLANIIIRESGVDITELIEEIDSSMVMRNNLKNLKNNENENSRDRKDNLKFLTQFGYDLTGKAKRGELDPVIGREKEIERLIHVLCRRSKNNPCLIGEPGVGKSAIVNALAIKIANKDVPSDMVDKVIISLDLNSVIAGTKYRGDFENRIKSIVKEVEKSDNIILFIDEIHTIVGAGAAEGSADAANILKPILSDGRFKLIGATTTDEYRKCVEKDRALERRLQPVTIGEATKEATMEILLGIRSKLEEHHHVEITSHALKTAVELSSRYITDRFLPDKAIDLIDEAAAYIHVKEYSKSYNIDKIENKIAKMETEKKNLLKKRQFEALANIRKNQMDMKKTIENINKTKLQNSGTVNSETVAKMVSKWTNIPTSRLTEAESDKLLNMESELHKRIIGQKRAVSAVSSAIRRGRVGLNDPNRPIGSFLFLGSTGVGKTELSKAIAKTLFYDEKFLVRIDMSEYMEKHSVSKLIGAPPGYVGYEDEGKLIKQVRTYPYSVILFDEIEKAHEDVFHILLQVLDDGRLTDGKNRTVDFKNTIIIMTSNIGGEILTKEQVGLGFYDAYKNVDDKDRKDQVIKKLKNKFRPEFLNRIDEIIIFDNLQESEINTIAHKLLDELSERALKFGIKLKFTENTIKQIAKEGYDKENGARPIKRVIEKRLSNKLCNKLLQSELDEESEVICDYKDGEYTFSKARSAAMIK
jgi:ATP-dependent Clp protease ATP-binding subunit ClpC